MGEQTLEEKARWIVYEYVKNKLARRGTHPTFGFDEIRLVWFCKTLQNWKALVITTLPDEHLYEVTYNGDTNEAYLDAYVKEENVVIPDN